MKEDRAKKDTLHTKIWREESQAENPFMAEACFCAGYNVYEDILKNASWFEYVYLLFKQERPNKWQVELLERVAVAIANPGIRDHSVRAAMNAGVGGSTSASALIAALAVGAGQLGGAREVYIAIKCWNQCQQNLNEWEKTLQDLQKKEVDGWPEMEHPPGFDPNGVKCAKPVIQLLDLCANYENAINTIWLRQNRLNLENITNMPLTMTGVISAVFKDIGFNEEESEMLYLFLRLPGAAVHSLEQKALGWRKYPFFKNNLKVI